MEAIHDPGQSSVSWVARLLQVLLGRTAIREGLTAAVPARRRRR